jgi:cytoskeletal protein CcmA (bactofilin family)
MAQRETERTPSASVIGEGTAVVGHVTGDEDLRVLGRIDGTIDLAGTLVVEASGIVKAETKVRAAVIHGVVVGTISAESVELAPGARMVGDVIAPRVILAEGAAFRGRIDMGDLEVPRAEVERAVRPVQVRPIHAARPAAPAPRPRAATPLPRIQAAAPRPAPAPARPAPPPPAAPAPTPAPASASAPAAELPAEVAAAALAAEGDAPPPVPASAQALGARRKVVKKAK